MVDERWMEIDGFNGRYQVSDLGRVRSNYGDRWRVLSAWLSKGYPQVHLSIGGKTYARCVHCLVLEAFVGPRPGSDYDACHNDGNPENNRLSNLRWDTRSGNFLDKRRHGTAGRSESSRAAVSKLNPSAVVEILQYLERGVSQYALASLYGVHQSTISGIKRGRSWKDIPRKEIAK